MRLRHFKGGTEGKAAVGLSCMEVGGVGGQVGDVCVDSGDLGTIDRGWCIHRTTEGGFRDVRTVTKFTRALFRNTTDQVSWQFVSSSAFSEFICVTY